MECWNADAGGLSHGFWLGVKQMAVQPFPNNSQEVSSQLQLMLMQILSNFSETQTVK
jgi:hypothetical protein